MSKAWFVTIIMVLSSLSLSMVTEGASAHSPTFPGDNTSLANATMVEDPSKSWAIYTHLEEGTFQYYSVDLKAGDRLYLNLIIPTHEKGTGFDPDLTVLGPFAEKNGTLPSGVELPTGLGWKTINGSMPAVSTYEPFSPSAFFNLATFDELVPTGGRYYIVVFQDPAAAPIHGDYGLAVGYVESFTLTEFVLIPFSLLNVYQWEGQSLLLVMLPVAAMLLVGLLVIYMWRKAAFLRMDLFCRFTLVAGLLYLGTAATTIIQTVISLSQTGLVAESILTMIFIIAPLLLGLYSIRIALQEGPVLKRTRIGMFVIGLIGLFVWAGLIIGPIVSMVSSIMPGNGRR